MLNKWDNEPDEVIFEHEGYKCIVYRHPEFKFLCGYVAIPEGHPFFKQDYSEWLYDKKVENGNPKEAKYDKEIADKICSLECHGGVTFAGYLRVFTEDWLIGFDANHSWDSTPPVEIRPDYIYGGERDLYGMSQYRTIEYMSEQCKILAEQIKGYADAK